MWTQEMVQWSVLLSFVKDSRCAIENHDIVRRGYSDLLGALDDGAGRAGAGGGRAATALAPDALDDREFRYFGFEFIQARSCRSGERAVPSFFVKDSRCAIENHDIVRAGGGRATAAFVPDADPQLRAWGD